MKFHRLLWLLGTLCLQPAWADVAPLKDLPGSIPLSFERQCAVDLVYQGKNLQPDEACNLAKNAEEKFKASGGKDLKLRFDISTLSPDPTSYLIQGQDGRKKLYHVQDPFQDINNFAEPKDGGFYNDLKAMDIKDDGDIVDYDSETDLTTGKYAIIVNKKGSDGQTHKYQLRMDLIGHNLLLRKTLLRKIGYNIPLMDRLKTVKVRFSSDFERRSFIKNLADNTFTEPERWVIDGGDLKEGFESEVLTLQDVIVMEGARDTTFNVARGAMTAQTIQGRRVLNALYIPYAITHAAESINLTDWKAGEIFNGQLSLNYESSKQFSPSYEDARWIARKIMKLSRQDWAEVVSSAKIPTEAGILLLEKLISRRNIIREQLNLNKESGHPDAAFETSVLLPISETPSYGKKLVEGKLINTEKLADGSVDKKWPGYARQFGSVDPDSPQSAEELMGLAKFEVMANIVRNVITKFNNGLPNNKDQAAIAEIYHDLDLSAWQFGQYIKTKEMPKIPRKLWSTKVWKLFAVPDRDIIAGNYMGAQNQIQVADSLTIGGELGRAGKWDGLPAKMAIHASAKLVVTKSWVHLRPIKSMIGAFTKKFKNIIVPYYEHQTRRPLNELLELQKEMKQIKDSQKQAASDLQKASTPEEKKKVQERIKALTEQKTEWDKKFETQTKNFDDMFAPRESVMVSTSIGPDFSIILSKGLTHDISAYIRARDRLVDMSRMHIFRKSDKKVQIYFDPTLYNEFSIGFGLQAKIPLLSFDWSFKDGATTTNFFEYNIDSNLEKNPSYFDSITAVSAALKGASVEYFKSTQKPMVIKHNFDDDKFKVDLLWWRYQSEHSIDRISVKSTDGVSQDYIRVVDGYRKGPDYQTFLVNATAAMLREHYPNLEFVINTSGNSGDTIGGKSVSRHVTLESEKTPMGLRVDNMLINMIYNWKGWSQDREDAEAHIAELKKHFQTVLFKYPDLSQVKKIEFYNLQVRVTLYQEAFNYLRSLTDDQIDAIFADYGTSRVVNYDVDTKDSWGIRVKIKMSDLRKHWMKDQDKAADDIIQIMEVLQNKLEFPGLLKMVGGIQNLYLTGTYDGFRKGDPKGRYAIDATPLGNIGIKGEPFGPMGAIIDKTGIANGELFISWLLSPL